MCLHTFVKQSNWVQPLYATTSCYQLCVCQPVCSQEHQVAHVVRAAYAKAAGHLEPMCVCNTELNTDKQYTDLI